MGWLENLRKNRVARQYARKLPAMLKRSWGRSDHYTPAQIATAAKKLKLPLPYIALGYAAFLPEHAFDQLQAEMPVSLSYQEARGLFFRQLEPKALPDWTMMDFSLAGIGGDMSLGGENGAHSHCNEGASHCGDGGHSE